MAQVRPYGSWASPLRAHDLVQGALRLGHPCYRAGRYYWQEGRPSQQGRVALVSMPVGGGDLTEVLPDDMSARTMVHEYGGRAWAAGPDGLVVTSNLADQGLWTVRLGALPVPLTPQVPSSSDGPAAWLPADRYASPVVSPDGAWVVCVRERHLPGEEARNDLVAISLSGTSESRPGLGEPVVLAEGHDFYSSPAFSAAGDQLAYVCWDHPDMPWDTSQLCRARFAAGALQAPEVLVPAEAGESVLQPGWAPDGQLYYLSDRSGWWGLYGEEGPLAPMEAEVGGPAWVLGESFYTFLADGTLVATWAASGRGYLGTVTGEARAVPLGFTRFYDLAPAGPAAVDGVLAVAASPNTSPQLVRVSLDGEVEVLRSGGPEAVPAGFVSVGEPFAFPTGQGGTAHGTYYPPVNPGYVGPDGAAPPLIVTSHGGPTSAAMTTLSLPVQYWTTRGFAVADIDYRGSTGYGRAYRRSLYGHWGEADVEDCAHAALWLAQQGRADGRRMVIRGGSASGLTALAALARYDIFAGATTFYGVGDLAALATSTHKFESRYLDRLVPADQIAARSPVNMVERISSPVLLLQGLDDKVVPPTQSRDMARRLRQGGVEAYLVEIEGEGHGFRRAATLVRAQELELVFYSHVLGFTPEGDMTAAYRDLAAAADEVRARWL